MCGSASVIRTFARGIYQLPCVVLLIGWRSPDRHIIVIIIIDVTNQHLCAVVLVSLCLLTESSRSCAAESTNVCFLNLCVSLQESVFPSSIGCSANMSTSNLSTGESSVCLSEYVCVCLSTSCFNYSPVCPQWKALTGCVFLSVPSVSRHGCSTCVSFLLTSLNRKCLLWRCPLAK